MRPVGAGSGGVDDGAGAVAPGAVVSGPAALEPTAEEWQDAAADALEYAALNHQGVCGAAFRDGPRPGPSPLPLDRRLRDLSRMLGAGIDPGYGSDFDLRAWEWEGRARPHLAGLIVDRLRERRGVDATVKLATAAPLGVKRSSGSAVRFPMMVMMVSPAMALSPFPVEAQASGRSSLVRRTVSLRPSWRSSSWAISGVVVMSTTA